MIFEINEKENKNNNFNIINEKPNNIINSVNSNNISDVQLKTSPQPNFFFKENIISYCDCICGLNESFDVFKSIKNNNTYLIISNKENNNIEIIDLISKEIIKSIEGNGKYIYLKYYLNPINNREYLITADIKSIIKVIDISDNYNIISQINFSKEFKNTWIFLNCAIIFNIQINSQKLDILLISSRAKYREEYPTKIYNLANGQFLKDINNTEKNKTRFIIPWYNESNGLYYIIECCEDLLIVVNILHNEVYAKLEEERYKIYSSGFVHKENKIDYLYVSNSSSEIKIWNLIDKELVKLIKISEKFDNRRLYGLLFWNKSYLVVNDDTNKAIKVVDLEQNKAVSHIYNKHEGSVRCLKRITHPEYGECLLTGGDDHKIKLWIIPKITINIFE